MNRIKFGICGLGRIGLVHLRHFSAAQEKYQPVALCDLDAQKAAGLAREHGCAAFSDFSAFLDDPQMELAIIATRSLDHAKNAQAALAAGKTVLLEKPIGVTSADYRLLQKLVREYPGKLYFLHNHRFEPAFTQMRSIIASGILGKLCVVKLCKHHGFIRRNDWQMRLDCGGGQLSVWGPHLLDQGLQLLSAPVKNVESYLRRVLTPGDGDDHVKITLTGENDVVAELEISNSVALPAPYCAIYGDRGTLMYGQDQKRIQLRYLEPDYQWPDTPAEIGTPQPDFWEKINQGVRWREETREVTPATNLWDYVEIALAEHLYNALRNEVPFPVTSAQALEVMRITEMVKQQNPQFAWIGDTGEASDGTH